MKRWEAILFAAALLISGFSAAYAAEPFSFVQLCDPQLGATTYPEDTAAFEQAMKQINALHSEFVVICGDLVNLAEKKEAWEDFNAIRAKFSVPCYCVPGNHDVGTPPTPETLERYRKLVGPDYQAVTHRGYCLVLTNTSLWKSNVPEESEKHDAWFRKTLLEANQQGAPILVAGHYPPFLEKPDEKEEYFNLAEPERVKLLKLMKSCNVKAFLAGHTHRNIVLDYMGMAIVASGATSMNQGTTRGFRVWQVDAEGGMTHEYVLLDPQPEPVMTSR